MSDYATTHKKHRLTDEQKAMADKEVRLLHAFHAKYCAKRGDDHYCDWIGFCTDMYMRSIVYWKPGHGANIGSFFYRNARREMNCHAARCAKKRIAAMGGDILNDVGDEREELEEYVVDENFVDELMSFAPDIHRKVMRLNLVDGLGAVEIANRLKIDRHRVSNILAEARDIARFNGVKAVNRRGETVCVMKPDYGPIFDAKPV
jgi:DNA-directed RNA polymerase specialized sigma24 family protein